MCGIVGYIGKDNSLPILLDGLSKLEYRGYDSAGVSFFNDKNELVVKKEKGKLEELKKLVSYSDVSNVGIGHTRWATHGEPSRENSHPHLSQDHRVAVVHNGIIENYSKLKTNLINEHRIAFKSETDTEVIAHLVELELDKAETFLDAVKNAVEKMTGAYALGVMSTEYPDQIIAVRKDSPLIVGVKEGENFIASDVPAIMKYTRDVYYIENDEYVVLTKDSVTIYDKDLNEVTRDLSHVDWEIQDAEKGGYEHFTLKEIHEQPKGLNDTITSRLEDGDIQIELSFTKEYLESIEKIYIVACGTAYHAGLIGKYFIENVADIPVHVDIASEFRYNKQFINDKSLFIAVSQSGETLDTLHALRKAKEAGAKVMSILNVVGSSIARESDEVFYTWAGPEIGVASTKAYTTQLASFMLIGLKIAKLLGRIDDVRYSELINSLQTLPKHVEEVLSLDTRIKNIAAKYYENEKIFFVGRGYDYYSALEASLKLKEISYINSFAIQAGELKHGTIALVEDESLAIAFMAEESLYEKMLSNVKEIKARGASVISIANEGHTDVEEVSDHVVYIPKVDELLSPILSIIPAQIFAYYVSSLRGNDVDKPRNLAKSVTVE